MFAVPAHRPRRQRSPVSSRRQRGYSAAEGAAGESSRPYTRLGARVRSCRQSRLSTLPEYCDGAYVEPAFPPLQKGELETLPMHAQAQQLQYWLKDRAELSGSVEVTRGNQSLIANAGDVSRDERRRSTVDNGVTLRQPGMLIVGESADLHDRYRRRVESPTRSSCCNRTNCAAPANVLDRSGDGDFRGVARFVHALRTGQQRMAAHEQHDEHRRRREVRNRANAVLARARRAGVLHAVHSISGDR